MSISINILLSKFQSNFYAVYFVGILAKTDNVIFSINIVIEILFSTLLGMIYTLLLFFLKQENKEISNL